MWEGEFVLLHKICIAEIIFRSMEGMEGGFNALQDLIPEINKTF